MIGDSSTAPCRGCPHSVLNDVGFASVFIHAERTRGSRSAHKPKPCLDVINVPRRQFAAGHVGVGLGPTMPAIRH